MNKETTAVAVFIMASGTILSGLMLKHSWVSSLVTMMVTAGIALLVYVSDGDE